MRIVIFAGTSEGKALALALAEAGHQVTATVATDYGKDVFTDFFKGHPSITTLEGRLKEAEMVQLIQQQDLVLDATHPFATEVSKNILTACEIASRDYLRILRDSVQIEASFGPVQYVQSIDEAIQVMNASEGKVLMTTGSKDLAKYTQVKDYQDRLYPRILSDQASLEIAERNGYKRSNIICMQGPFTAEVNSAMMQMIGAKYLLTKETGGSGGFYEKLQGCAMAGGTAIVIARPQEEVDKQVQRRIATASCTAADLAAFLQQEVGDVDGVKDFSLTELEAFQKKLEESPLENKQEGLSVAEGSHKQLRFPIFIDLEDQLVVVVGSGKIAQRRMRTLLAYGAKLRIISPRAGVELPEDIQQNYQQVEIWARDYEAGDLQGAVLAIAATDQRQTNQALAEEARAEKIFVSIADRKEESSFYFPAVWTGSKLSVGIVSDGQDHHYMKKSADKIRALLDALDLEEENEKN